MDELIQENNIGCIGDDTVGIASGVPIYDANDIVEVAIKNNLEIHKPYKSWNTIFDTIGKDTLFEAGIKDLRQNFYRKKAIETIQQYGEFPMTGRTKYERIVADLYEIPRLDLETNIGGNRFYRERGIPLFLMFLKTIDECTGFKIYTSTNEIALQLGLINKCYGVQSSDLIQEYPKLTDAMVRYFYFQCKPELEKVIFGILDELQEEFRILKYKRSYHIKTADGDDFDSFEYHDKIIMNAERIVLKEFKLKRVSDVFRKKLSSKFYSRVVEHINQQYNFDWVGYRKQIEIEVFDFEDINNWLDDYSLTDEKRMQYLLEINGRFRTRIQNRIISDYDRINAKADKVIEEYLDNVVESDSYKTLIEHNYTHDEAIQKLKPSTFRVHKNCYEYQNELINLLLSIEQ